MGKAVIFCKSFDLNIDNIDNIDNITASIGMADIYIAADSGLETAEKFKITPDIIIGDLDSVNPERLDRYKNILKILKYPSEKDDTDTMLCVKYALEHGYQSILIIGGLGGRIDHTLSNLSLLKYIYNCGGSGTITDGFNCVYYLKNCDMTILRRSSKYISIIPISEELRGVTLKGFKYNLENAVVKFDEPYTISNEINEILDEKMCMIEIKDGEAYICECD